MKTILLIIFLIASVSMAAQAPVRVNTTKNINLTQFAVELEAVSNKTNIPLRTRHGEFVENPSGVVTQAELQQAVDAHVAVPTPPGPTPTAQYNTLRALVSPGPERDMFDFFAEQHGLR